MAPPAASTWFNDDQYAETVEFYEPRIDRDIVEFVKETLLDPGRKYGALLEIGPGAGAQSRGLASHFDRVDVIEPNPSEEYLKNYAVEPAFNVRTELLQDAKLEREIYDLVVCSHVYYHIPQNLWTECLLKTMDALRPGGRMILALSAPRGAWQDHLLNLTGVGPEDNAINASTLFKSVRQLNYPCQAYPTQEIIKAEPNEYRLFHSMVRLFSWNQGKTEEMPMEDQLRAEKVIHEMAKRCFDKEKQKYVLVQESDYIVVTKPE